MMLSAFASGYSMPDAKIPLTLLSKADAPNARCMDGSLGGYYHAANASSSAASITSIARSIVRTPVRPPR